MNFIDLVNTCKDVLGIVDSGRCQDRRLQAIRDAINQTQDEICAAAPDMWSLIREDSISVVAGTSTYTLNDWCKRPLSFWTTDSSGHKIDLVMPRNADRDGSRASGASSPENGPYRLTFGPRTSSALVSGSSGASATEAATTITSGGSTFSGITSTHYGRMIRLNGEDADYQLTLKASTTLTVDRAIVGRLTGTGVTGTGVGYTSARWEVSPPGRIQVVILPTTVTSASTVYYRYQALPRRLVNTTDAPEILTEYHHLLWKGALRMLALKRSEMEDWQAYIQEFSAGIAALKISDRDDVDNEEGATYASSLDGSFDSSRYWPRGTYSRLY